MENVAKSDRWNSKHYFLIGLEFGWTSVYFARMLNITGVGQPFEINAGRLVLHLLKQRPRHHECLNCNHFEELKEIKMHPNAIFSDCQTKRPHTICPQTKCPQTKIMWSFHVNVNSSP